MARSILGISAYYHDSAAVLVSDGNIVAAAQEERFTRKKHDAAFPAHAVEYCLREAKLQPSDVDFVAYYEKPLLKFERILDTLVASAPLSLRAFMTAMPVWLREKLHLPREIHKALGGRFSKRIIFPSHHECHAACAFFPSPFQEAAILTIDGVGEWDTASIGVGKGGKIEVLKTLRFPHSLGLLYSAFTAFCGFRVNSGEYKLMGLAPYGEPRFTAAILRELLDLKADGSFRLNMRYFNFAGGLTMTSHAFARFFGGRARKQEEAITQREMDLAASIQAVTTEIVLRLARYARALTGQRNLCLAGGVALNCVANGELLRANVFEKIWIPPAAGDAGGALGAALLVSHQLLGAPREQNGEDSLRGGLLGPSFTNEEIRAALDFLKVNYAAVTDESELLALTAESIAVGNVVGWFQGRMEFGPRALGARSILGDPRNPSMQSRMNLRIKFRESFRPFAPSCLAADVPVWFELDSESPYMLFVASIRSAHRKKIQPTHAGDSDLCRRVNEPRSTLPAVTHVDFSARIQTVTERANGRFWRLLQAFKQRTGCGVLVNTSFNVRSEPIVCTPEDAVRCFLSTDMDMLVLGDFILRKDAQAPMPETEKARHVHAFSPD